MSGAPAIFRAATEGDRDAWQEVLARSASGDFLHDWAWAEVAAFDGEPQRRFVVESGTELLALCAAQGRRTFLARSIWYVPHGPVLDYDAPQAGDALGALLAGLRREAHRARAIVVILEPRLEAESTGIDTFRGRALRASAATLQVGQTRIVDVSGTDDELLAQFDKDTRYAVRRAEREGVDVRCITDARDRRAVDSLHALVAETQRRAGFPLPALERYRTAWRALATERRASILEVWHGQRLMASGMLVVEGHRSFYLFSGSRREEPDEPKVFASYALQWAMMRTARRMGSRHHDLWGIAPADAGPEHPWYGVGLFKKGFGGRAVRWAGTWELTLDPGMAVLRRSVAGVRSLAARVR